MRAWMSSKYDQMRPLVSTATDWVTVGKNGFITFSRTFFIGFISYLQVTMIHKSPNEFEIQRDLLWTTGWLPLSV